MTNPGGQPKAESPADVVGEPASQKTAPAKPAPVSSSGEPTPWGGDPGFPVAPDWMVVDPRWVRKGIPRWIHYALFSAWAIFVTYILFLFFFHTPGKTGFDAHPPADLPGKPGSGKIVSPAPNQP